jgi:hypothetical protein
MRPRVELAIAAGIVLVLGIGAAVLGSREARTTDEDTRRSTYLVGPSGAKGWADALTALGVQVEHFRRPTDALGPLDTSSVFAVLGPAVPLDSREGARLSALPGDLLLAGPGTDAAIACLGYRVSPRHRDSTALRVPTGAEALPMPYVRAELVRHFAQSIVDSSNGYDGGRVSCTVPVPDRVDTVLRTRGDRPVILRLGYPSGRAAILIADDELFRNRTLRHTAMGPIALGLVTPRYRRVVVDEFHQGFATSASLAGAAFQWSLHSPWGWVAWQLAVVGVIALFAAGVRFGPARHAIPRRRRSPLEHVRALATALAAARGHDTAARLMVQGLRRRLSRAGKPGPADLDRWLAGLTPAVRTDRGRDALAVLTARTRRPPSSQGVLEAANAVETLWDELKPS